MYYYTNHFKCSAARAHEEFKLGSKLGGVLDSSNSTLIPISLGGKIELAEKLFVVCNIIYAKCILVLMEYWILNNTSQPNKNIFTKTSGNKHLLTTFLKSKLFDIFLTAITHLLNDNIKAALASTSMELRKIIGKIACNTYQAWHTLRLAHPEFNFIHPLQHKLTFIPISSAMWLHNDDNIQPDIFGVNPNMFKPLLSYSGLCTTTGLDHNKLPPILTYGNAFLHFTCNNTFFFQTYQQDCTTPVILPFLAQQWNLQGLDLDFYQGFF